MDTTQMTIVLAIVYFIFWVWGSRKAQVNTAVNTDDDCGYINYFPEELEEEEEESLKAPPHLSSITEPDWSTMTDEQFVSGLTQEEEDDLVALAECLFDYPNSEAAYAAGYDREEYSWLPEFYAETSVAVAVAVAVAVEVLPDPWELETEFAVAQLEVCYQLPEFKTVLALPPAKEVVIEEDPESQCAEDSLNYDIAQYHLMLSLMTIRELKQEAKRVKLPRYGNMKKAELLSALKAFTV